MSKKNRFGRIFDGFLEDVETDPKENVQPSGNTANPTSNLGLEDLIRQEAKVPSVNPEIMASIKAHLEEINKEGIDYPEFRGVYESLHKIPNEADRYHTVFLTLKSLGATPDIIAESIPQYVEAIKAYAQEYLKGPIEDLKIAWKEEEKKYAEEEAAYKEDAKQLELIKQRMEARQVTLIELEASRKDKHAHYIGMHQDVKVTFNSFLQSMQQHSMNINQHKLTLS